MEHTSAPWISTEEGDANFYFVMAPDNQWLMRIQQNGELMLAEQRQNMKLICTAPELLKALTELKDEAIANCPLDNKIFNRDLMRKIDNAKAAIKKATE